MTWEKIDANEYIQKIIELHFGADGSQYCHDLEKRFPNIDFKKDIQTPEDRIHLPVETDEIVRAHSAEYFVPKSILRENKEMYYGMSSGTTGPRKTIPWLKDTFDVFMDWFEWNFSLYGISKGKDILSYANSGLFQKAMECSAARLNARNIHIINDDLGELKKLFSDDKTRAKVARRIYENELRPILKGKNNVGTIVTLGPIIAQIDLEDVPSGTSFFIGGFGVNDKEYEELKTKFAGRVLKECYGNIFWTWAFSPYRSGYVREYYPPYPYIIFDIADVNDSGNLLSYGELGQVVVTRFTKDMIFRWKERDVARLVRPKDQFGWDGVSDIAPFRQTIG